MKYILILIFFISLALEGCNKPPGLFASKKKNGSMQKDINNCEPIGESKIKKYKKKKRKEKGKATEKSNKRKESDSVDSEKISDNNPSNSKKEQKIARNNKYPEKQNNKGSGAFFYTILIGFLLGLGFAVTGVFILLSLLISLGLGFFLLAIALSILSLTVTLVGFGFLHLYKWLLEKPIQEWKKRNRLRKEKEKGEE